MQQQKQIFHVFIVFLRQLRAFKIWLYTFLWFGWFRKIAAALRRFIPNNQKIALCRCNAKMETNEQKYPPFLYSPDWPNDNIFFLFYFCSSLLKLFDIIVLFWLYTCQCRPRMSVRRRQWFLICFLCFRFAACHTLSQCKINCDSHNRRTKRDATNPGPFRTVNVYLRINLSICGTLCLQYCCCFRGSPTKNDATPIVILCLNIGFAEMAFPIYIATLLSRRRRRRQRQFPTQILSLCVCVCSVLYARWRCGCVWRVSLPAPVTTTTTKTVVVSDSNFTHHCSWNCKKIQFDFFASFSCRIPLETIHKANWKRNRTIVLYCWFDAILFHTCRMENFLVLLLVLVLLLLFRAFEFC